MIVIRLWGGPADGRTYRQPGWGYPDHWRVPAFREVTFGVPEDPTRPYESYHLYEAVLQPSGPPLYIYRRTVAL